MSSTGTRLELERLLRRGLHHLSRAGRRSGISRPPRPAAPSRTGRCAAPVGRAARRAAPATAPNAHRACCPRPRAPRRGSPSPPHAALRERQVSSRKSDSGVVIRISGGRRANPAILGRGVAGADPDGDLRRGQTEAPAAPRMPSSGREVALHVRRGPSAARRRAPGSAGPLLGGAAAASRSRDQRKAARVCRPGRRDDQRVLPGAGSPPMRGSEPASVRRTAPANQEAGQRAERCERVGARAFDFSVTCGVTFSAGGIICMCASHRVLAVDGRPVRFVVRHVPGAGPRALRARRGHGEPGAGPG